VPTALEQFFAALPRQGPGSRDATARALARVGELPNRPRVVDFGCGSGAATRVLAELLPDARIDAIDTSEALLERLQQSDPAGRIIVRQASMLEPGESMDLAWSEGAVYTVGVTEALQAWAPRLRPGGRVVFSDLVWFVPEPERPREAVEFWAANHPRMRDEAGMREQIEGLGYRVRFELRLEDAAWFDYYAAIEARAEALRESTDPELASLIAALATELALYRRCGRSYGYAFFGLERPTAVQGTQ
jgi:SAM-dependent methyltransferase